MNKKDIADLQDDLLLKDIRRRKDGYGVVPFERKYEIDCERCGDHVKANGPTQRYCKPCVPLVEAERNKKQRKTISDTTYDLPEGKIITLDLPKGKTRVIIRRVD